MIDHDSYIPVTDLEFQSIPTESTIYKMVHSELSIPVPM